MTFAELRDRSRPVAGVLAGRGIGPETTVGLAIPRSLDSIVALFAVLRAGAAYVPLELDHPDERIAAIVADARPGRDPHRERRVTPADRRADRTGPAPARRPSRS